MVSAGDNMFGSQFFITLGPTSWLDGKHAIFGRVNSGMHNVKQLGQVRLFAFFKLFNIFEFVKSFNFSA